MTDIVTATKKTAFIKAIPGSHAIIEGRVSVLNDRNGHSCIDMLNTEAVATLGRPAMENHTWIELPLDTSNPDIRRNAFIRIEGTVYNHPTKRGQMGIIPISIQRISSLKA